MSYKTINITAIEYYRYTIILCIEYVTPTEKKNETNLFISV